MSEINDHKKIIRERLVDRGLSVMELRREARQQHMNLLDPVFAPDSDMVVAELEVIDTLIGEMSPPPPTLFT